MSLHLCRQNLRLHQDLAVMLEKEKGDDRGQDPQWNDVEENVGDYMEDMRWHEEAGQGQTAQGGGSGRRRRRQRRRRQQRRTRYRALLFRTIVRV